MRCIQKRTAYVALFMMANKKTLEECKTQYLASVINNRFFAVTMEVLVTTEVSYFEVQEPR